MSEAEFGNQSTLPRSEMFHAVGPKKRRPFHPIDIGGRFTCACLGIFYGA